MDISFHYYAVKSIAIICGFNEPDAELIATYSQFVDDYKVNKKLRLTNIPPYCNRLIQGDKFQTVQTGFGYVEATKNDIQKNVIMPFHFIPENSAINEQYETKPAKYFSNCLIDSFMKDAVEKCLQHPNNKEYLVSLGLLTHTFADTYAHAEFSAFNSDANKGDILTSIDSNGKERKHTLPPLLPPIGHAYASTAPDESDLYFEFNFTKKERKFRRENWNYFSACAVEIGKYFCDVCRVNWSSAIENRINIAISLGCRIENTNQEMMQAHWRKVDFALSAIPFRYVLPLQNLLIFDEHTLPIGITKMDVFKLLENDVQENSTLYPLEQEIDFSQLKAQASNEFYRYNYTAFELREAVLGRNREERQTIRCQ